MNDSPSEGGDNDAAAHAIEIKREMIPETGMCSDYYNEISSVGGGGTALILSIGVHLNTHGNGWRLLNYEAYFLQYGIKPEEFSNPLTRPRILVLNKAVEIMNDEIAHYGTRKFDTEKFEQAWNRAYEALFLDLNTVF